MNSLFDCPLDVAMNAIPCLQSLSDSFEPCPKEILSRIISRAVGSKLFSCNGILSRQTVRKAQRFTIVAFDRVAREAAINQSNGSPSSVVAADDANCRLSLAEPAHDIGGSGCVLCSTKHRKGKCFAKQLAS